MEAPRHTMTNLFAQLGLPSDSAGIDRFIRLHSPLHSSTLLADASFWTSAQSEFLLEGILVDADWAEVIDALNERLRGRNQ